VESSVISIDRRGETQSVELSIFREIVRASFANRRKSLVNNLLASKMGVKRVEIEPIIRERFGDVKVRAERLSVWEFTVLAKEIQPLLEKKR
jgi:16S rRNA (adenine1518-N6/adenine1519-N6)-dimethyltransferase